jgi:hypothetical protein
MRAREWGGTAIAATCAAGAAVVLAFAGRELDERSAAALLYELEALAAALVTPWLVARALEDEEAGRPAELGARARAWGAGLAGAAAVALGLALARSAPGLGGALLAQAIVLLEGISLGAIALAVGSRRGSGAGLATGLAAAALLLGFPYVGGDIVAALPHDAEALSVYWLVASAPAIALAGTCAGAEPFHSPVLYARFRPTGEGEVSFQHASPARALAVQAGLAAIAAGCAFAARRLPRRRAGALAAGAIALLLLGPSRADAQVVGGGGGDASGSSDQGSFGVEVKLGYLYPFLEGNFRIKSTYNSLATRLDLQKDLHIQPAYILPTFDLQFGWRSIGRVWFDYFEIQETGEFGRPFEPTYYRNVVIPPNEVALATYGFRTIGLHGAMAIPILDFVTLELIATTRYVWFHSTVRAPRVPFTVDESHLEAIIPGLGPGFDLSLLDKLYLSGDFAWIDFSVPKEHPLVHYREGHLGGRYELFDHLHIGAEVVWLEVDLQNSRFNYVQRVIGPRIWVAAVF